MRDMNSGSIPGLLIEGVDYSGKTTVTNALETLMTQQGYRVYRRACFMHEHPIIDSLLALAKSSEQMDTRDVCYTASILLDASLPPLPAPDAFLLQERHLLTQIGRNTFFYADEQRWQVDTLKQLYRPFSSQVYLSSSLAAKQARTRTRPPKSPRDAMLANDPELHQRYDDYVRDSLPANENWLVIDTSALDIAQVAARIFDHLETHDEHLQHARS